MGVYRPLVICEIFYGNSRIIATNDGKTAPGFKRKYEDGVTSYAGHAEMRALSMIPKSWNKKRIRMEVKRVKKDGTLAMARPCVHCQAHLWRNEIRARQVFFTNDDGVLERFRDE